MDGGGRKEEVLGLGTGGRSRPNPFFEQEAFTVAQMCELITFLVSQSIAFGISFEASNDAAPPVAEFLINLNNLQSLVLRFVIYRP